MDTTGSSGRSVLRLIISLLATRRPHQKHLSKPRPHHPTKASALIRVVRPTLTSPAVDQSKE